MTLREDETRRLATAQPEPAAVALAQWKLGNRERIDQQRPRGKMPGYLRGVAEPLAVALPFFRRPHLHLPPCVAKAPGQFAQAVISDSIG